MCIRDRSSPGRFNYISKIFSFLRWLKIEFSWPNSKRRNRQMVLSTLDFFLLLLIIIFVDYGAETNCGIAHILPDEQLQHSYIFSNYYNLQSVHFEFSCTFTKDKFTNLFSILVLGRPPQRNALKLRVGT